MQVNGLVSFSMNQKEKITALYKKKVQSLLTFLSLIASVSDGTIVRYFTCNDNYGLYVRPGQIESVLNDLQPDLTRSASNHSIKSQGSSTGSIPPPSNSTGPRTSGIPAKQSGLRAPTPSTASKLPGNKQKYILVF